MADKIEHELAAGIEEDLAVKAMAAKLAPRPDPARPPQLDDLDMITRSPRSPVVASHGTVEAKLQAIEKLVGEIRAMSAQVKGLLG